MSLLFETPAGVFVPRPETEILVEAAEARLRGLPLESSIKVLDLCCGTGVIAVSLAARIPCLVATAVDISEPAVGTTLRNATLKGVADRVEAVQGEATAYLETGEYAAILCNPPYIETGDMQNLPPEVRDHEPRAALDGGADGLDFYRRLIPLLRPRLAEGGFVAFEIGDTQGPAVSELLRGNGFDDIKILHDLSHLPRVVFAQ
jgi:release factor glutamine methyltransferase